MKTTSKWIILLFVIFAEEYVVNGYPNENVKYLLENLFSPVDGLGAVLRTVLTDVRGREEPQLDDVGLGRRLFFGALRALTQMIVNFFDLGLRKILIKLRFISEIINYALPHRPLLFRFRRPLLNRVLQELRKHYTPFRNLILYLSIKTGGPKIKSPQSRIQEILRKITSTASNIVVNVSKELLFRKGKRLIQIFVLAKALIVIGIKIVKMFITFRKHFLNSTVLIVFANLFKYIVKTFLQIFKSAKTLSVRSSLQKFAIHISEMLLKLLINITQILKIRFLNKIKRPFHPILRFSFRILQWLRQIVSKLLSTIFNMLNRKTWRQLFKKGIILNTVYYSIRDIVTSLSNIQQNTVFILWKFFKRFLITLTEFIQFKNVLRSFVRKRIFSRRS
ncbi:hypothetical protein C0J52_04829 [Blattella germanica]|nr:hypothetical protein C0J52_04829 [Blattella germanica]